MVLPHNTSYEILKKKPTGIYKTNQNTDNSRGMSGVYILVHVYKATDNKNKYPISDYYK